MQVLPLHHPLRRRGERVELSDWTGKREPILDLFQSSSIWRVVLLSFSLF